MNKNKECGFTLIEMSIVLVIIGLIVGGILVGQDLINGAAIRAQVTQLERYKSAVNTFKNKYNDLPGDMTAVNASNFGFTSRSGTVGDGDGNGLIEECASGATGPGCETILFWGDLNQAGFIPGNFTPDTAQNGIKLSFLDNQQSFGSVMIDAVNPISDAYAASAGTTIGRSQALPVASINISNTYLTVFSASGINYFQLTGVVASSTAGAYVLFNNLTPVQAYAIDQKLDDGQPTTGVVQAMEGTGPLNNAAVPTPTTCINSTTSYNVGSTLGAIALCQLRFQF